MLIRLENLSIEGASLEPSLVERIRNEIVKITVSIPTGDRDGNPYDLDAEGESYQMSVKKKAEIAQKKAEAKAKKMEADRRKREAMAKLKAKQEQGAE